MYVRVPPKAAQGVPSSARSNGAFIGEAPWALSALPECFQQVQKVTGPAHFVLAHMPARADLVPEGTGIAVADCRLTIAADRIVVRRGIDKLTIPAPARLYRAAGILALLRGKDGGYELRVYRMHSP